MKSMWPINMTNSFHNYLNNITVVIELLVTDPHIFGNKDVKMYENGTLTFESDPDKMFYPIANENKPSSLFA